MIKTIVSPSPRIPASPFHRFTDSKKAGVTLIELLVAVTILSFLMVAFYTIFRGGTKAYDTGDKRVELTQNARIALDMMASEIRQALPPDAGANPEVVFEVGTYSTWITFYAPIDGEPGAEEITFSAFDYTLYKRVDNPTRWQPEDEQYTDPPASSNPVTAAIPGTEGIVSSLDIRQHDSDGLLQITLEVSVDPTDDSESTFSLSTVVKSAFRYGVGLGGDF